MPKIRIHWGASHMVMLRSCHVSSPDIGDNASGLGWGVSSVRTQWWVVIRHVSFSPVVHVAIRGGGLAKIIAV